MTIADTSRRAGPYTGNGVTTAFPFTYKVFEASDVQVVYTDALGTVTTLTSGFTITLNADQDNNPGGTVVYPSSGPTMASPATLLIVGDDLPYTQENDITNAGRFLPQVIEDSLDKLTILAQQNNAIASRALLFPVSDLTAAAQTTLPTAANRLDRMLAFDAATGLPVMTPFTSTQVASAVAAAYSAGGSTADAVIFVQAGMQAIARSVQARFRDTVHITDFVGGQPGGADVRPAVLSAIAALGSRGGTIIYPAGLYTALSGTLPDVENVYHVGAGINATEVRAGGDFPVFTRAGGPTTTINCGGIQNMLIRGYWNQNPAQRTNSHGIKTFGSNGARYSNLRIHSCFYGLYHGFTYESACDHIYILGAGTDQNYHGVAGELATLANVNNAMFMHHVVVFNTMSDGWLLPNPNGSILTACTAEACGGYGAVFGTLSVQAVPCQFLNVVNFLGDSGVKTNIVVQGHATQPAQRMLFSNNWSGLTSESNWVFTNVIETVFCGNNGISATRAALELNNAPITVVGFVASNYNTSNGGYGGVTIANTDGAVVTGCTMNTGFTGVGGQGLIESGTTNNSVITGNHLQTGATIIGAQSKVRDNVGFRTENSGSDQILAGATTKVIAHGLAMQPNFGEIRLQPSIPIAVGLSAVGATNFTVTIPVQVVNVDIGWGASITRG